MLVLSRKSNESIVITFEGKEVKLKVCSIKGDKVKLGFEADKDVLILREELIDNG